MKSSLGICLLMLFAVNSYAGVLVYDPGGLQAGIQYVMTDLGIAYDLRGPQNHVTTADLASADLLVIGWSYDGDMSGIKPSVLASAITGNILLTGHDADYHASLGNTAAATFFAQALEFARLEGGTGLVDFGDYSENPFSYLPEQWGISATGRLQAETVSAFTPAALATGLYAGLTPGQMSNWAQSYHDTFQAWSPAFTAFELGDYDQTDVLTIAVQIPEPATLVLLALGVVILRTRSDRPRTQLPVEKTT